MNHVHQWCLWRGIVAVFNGHYTQKNLFIPQNVWRDSFICVKYLWGIWHLWMRNAVFHRHCTTKSSRKDKCDVTLSDVPWLIQIHGMTDLTQTKGHWSIYPKSPEREDMCDTTLSHAPWLINMRDMRDMPGVPQHTWVHSYTTAHMYWWYMTSLIKCRIYPYAYEVATISRLIKISCLFCRISSL